MEWVSKTVTPTEIACNWSYYLLMGLFFIPPTGMCCYVNFSLWTLEKLWEDEDCECCYSIPTFNLFLTCGYILAAAGGWMSTDIYLVWWFCNAIGWKWISSVKSVGTFCNECCCICLGFWFVLFPYFELVSLHMQISFEKMFQEQITRKLEVVYQETKKKDSRWMTCYKYVEDVYQ
jgi:hypothetical protein